MKTVLIFPRLLYQPGDPPLGIAYIASAIREKTEWKVEIEDLTFLRSFEHYEKKIHDERPEIVGIYVDTLMFNDGIKAARIAKKKGCFVIAGGPHPTVMPQTIIHEVDIVVLGEGEQTFVEILNKFSSKDFVDIDGIWYNNNGKIIKNPKTGFIENLDSIPFPSRDLLDMKRYIKNWHLLDGINPNLRGTNIVASRGCPFNCSFCQPTLKYMFGNRVRFRKPENLIKEIIFLKKEHNLDAIFFHDDTFTFNKKWLKEFCGHMKADNVDILWGCNSRVDTIDEDMLKDMYSSGCRVLHVGIESGSDRILKDIYQKGITTNDVKRMVALCNKIGIKILGFFMLGAPTETEAEIKKTIKFACSLKINEVSFSITTPIPSTHLYNFMVKHNYKIKKDFSSYDYYSNKIFYDRHLSKEKLKNYQRLALLLFYIHPYRWNFVFKHLRTLTGIRKMLLKISRFI